MKKLFFLFLFAVNGCFSQNIDISGAGSPEVNGTYSEVGVSNGKPLYQLGQYQIEWNGDFWQIGEGWMPFYISYDNVATPDLVGSWMDYIGAFPSPTVSIAGPALSYSGSFVENRTENDGSFSSSITISFNGFGGSSFTGANGDNFVTAGKVSIANLPSGLTPVITRNSAAQLTFTLTGNASAHANANDLSNLSVVFQNTAFSTGNASAVASYSKSDISIEFIQQYTVGSTGYFTTISNAIASVQNYDVLILAAETFTESNISVNNKSISIIGQSPSQTIIQANANPGVAASRIFTINFSNYASTNAIRLEKLTIRNGNATNYAGGLFSSNANVEIENCLFENNYANTPVPDGYFGDGGGAMRVQDGSLSVLNSTFSGNRHNCVSNRPGDMMGGGAIGYFGQDSYNTLLNITNCTFSGNLTGNHGGALMLRPSNSAANRIVNCTFSGNSAGNTGGAVYFGGTGACQFSSTNSIYYGNTAGNCLSIYASFSSSFGFTNCVIQDNSNIGNMSATFTNCLINQNPLLSALSDNGGYTKTCALQEGSIAIDAGTTNGAPAKDQRSNSRVGAIDIGAFEFGAGSCTVPTVTASTPASRCDAGTVSIAATASAGSINWYDAETDGILVGSGTTFITPSISNTTTYYAEAVDGSCLSAGRTAVVVTVNTTPSISGTLSATSCEAGTFTLEAVPSAGTINWFADATGGSSLFTGTSFTTPSTYTSMTFYAEVENVGCINISRTAVAASRAECTKIQALQCGTTLASNASAINANAVVGATNYRFEVSGPNAYLQVVNTTARWFYLSDLPSYEFGQTYSIRVQASVNGGTTYSDYGQSCNISTVFPTTKIQTTQCGATLANNTLAIIANAVSGATNYSFEVSGPNGYLQVVAKSVRQLFLSDLPGYEFGQTYSIRVQVSLNNGSYYGPYGSACNITTANPTTQIQTSQCGMTLTNNSSAIIANAVVGATNYRFEVSGPNGFLQVISKSVRQLYFSDLTTYEKGQTYSIKVCLSSNNGLTYASYGSACNITTTHPTTQIQTTQCGTTLVSNATAIVANSVTGVANYRFEVSGPNGYLQVVTKTVRQLYLSDLPSYALGQTYSIRVQLRLTNATIYGPFGTACNITTSSTSSLATNGAVEMKSMHDESMFNFEAFPNPSYGDFTFSSSEVGTFNIINELGQLVKTVEITEANGNQVKVENMPNGAYFVTGTLNGETVTKKVIVVR